MSDKEASCKSFLYLVYVNDLLNDLEVSIINKLILPVPCVPNKREWKTIVNRTQNQSETALWKHRLAIDRGFTFFRILHPCITPSTLYRVCNKSSDRYIMSSDRHIMSSDRYIMLIVARLRTRPVVLENRLQPLQSCSPRGTGTCIV